MNETKETKEYVNADSFPLQTKEDMDYLETFMLGENVDNISEDKEPIKEVLWVNPKPNTKNKKKLESNMRVLVNGYPLNLKVYDITKEKNNSYNVSVINTKDSDIIDNLKPEDIYPLYKVDKDSIKVGNIIKYEDENYAARMGIITKIKDGLHLKGSVVIDKSNVIEVFSKTAPKEKCDIFSCGGISYKGTSYKNKKELLIDNPDVAFVYNKEELTLEYNDICHNYKVQPHELVPKEEHIYKLLRTALDHPLNIKKKQWACLVGPSGTGKTTLAEKYAEEKGIESILYQGNAQVTADDFRGYKSITTGKYFRSLLRDAVENGKIFILDEIDACNANTLIVLNSLKQDYYQFEDTKIKIHKDFRFIATANTLTHSEEYNARFPMDLATKARFDIIKYNLTEVDLCIRYGLKYIKEISNTTNIKRTTAREIDTAVTKLMIEETNEGEWATC